MYHRGTLKEVAKNKAAATKIQTLGRRRPAQKALARPKLVAKKQRSSVAIRTRCACGKPRNGSPRPRRRTRRRSLVLALQCQSRLLDVKRALALHKYLATVRVADLPTYYRRRNHNSHPNHIVLTLTL